ncbi:hypothetical protein FA15DRAFT_590555 [Coprinopsis marcescibilis]|uniref:AB hydrolase-1 domain-containing protein n=1 Tax=Coprinopsis marcescibilis TaxID=230819 RepID=A0A5C3KXM9_COPMA|nr:hypothetical protein FA15DRAFT_590555 [Coprinopsis marcescibilis]
MFDLHSIVINGNGTQLGYLDSGPPPSSMTYGTIFLVHGIIFTALVFRRVMEIAAEANLRIVSLNRRDYPGSTPLSPSDLGFIVNGTDSQKAQYLRDRGLEILQFMDVFIQTNLLPPISEDEKTGGSALLGWSLGNSFTLPGIARASELGAETTTRLSHHLRSLILQANLVLWFPAFDGSIASEDRTPFTIQWLTGYFDHGDISQRNETALAFTVPTTAKVPSIFKMHDHLPKMLVPEPFAVTGSDWLLSGNFGPQILKAYRSVCYSSEVKELFPRIKIWNLVGDSSGGFAIAAYWQVQDDDQAAGGENINYHVLSGGNHFFHWDYPSVTVQAYQRAIV